MGRTLAAWFAPRGYEVIVLTRRGRSDGLHARCVEWDARSGGAWEAELEGAAAVVNLAGRSVDCRYTARNRRAMIDSRVDSTRILGAAIASCSAPPPVWLNSSTATIYEHNCGPPHGEQGRIAAHPEAKDAFSIEVARAWEAAFDEAVLPATRKVALRTAMVFGREPGGVYSVMRRLTRLGLGGSMAGGKQYVSWLHERDFCRAIEWLIGRSEATGVYNLCAPKPVTNREMMRLLRGSLGMPLGLPATRLMLEVGALFLRTETELIIKSRRVAPERLVSEGFEFDFPELGEALADLAV